MNDSTKNLLGRKLRQVREDRNMTLTALAHAARGFGAVELTQVKLGQVERGARRILGTELAAVARVLDMSVEDIIWGDHGTSSSA